ncbi:glutaredoxin domain-containing cysteine-rich protein CG31559-like [Brevipalpus obovatus]|uniref:glutaredoxin domain-containing cysteine-rich protein CG31559-like n=1 Tax=Brevipalpus obovatus TaxID=246614 RepID=UPI003D9EEFD8
MITIISVNNGRHSESSSSSPSIESEDEGFSENSSLLGITIKGPSGSVRGIRHCVRHNVQSYYDIIGNSSQSSARKYAKEERNKCVLYSTTLGIVRKTFENCRKLRAILYQNLIAYEERDVYLNSDFREELLERHGLVIIPSLFVNGKYLGGIDVVEKLNETRQLDKILHKYKISKSESYRYFQVCNCCGNARYIPCNTCNGSKKSTVHHFVTDSITLRCSQCNATGLIKCPKCQWIEFPLISEKDASENPPEM